MLNLGKASLHYETAGNGQPMVFIHAGVADSRQWDNEFAHFAKDYFAIRYDMRGFGKSEPAGGEFRPVDDLTALLDHLDIEDPAIVVGCSMGGSLAMDLVLADPDKVAGIVMVGSGPAGLQLDVPQPEKFKLVEAADKAGDLELVCELETQIWFDGDRPTESVDADMRALAYEMNLLALQHDAKELCKRIPNTTKPASERLDEFDVPILAIIGEHDLPFMHAAAKVMAAQLADFESVIMQDAAHLPNMDHPVEFQRLVADFAAKISAA